MKIRTELESNYKAILLQSGKTIRVAIDDSRPITELIYPEFYDVDIFGLGQGLCNANCPYCYLSATSKGSYVKDAPEKIKEYFGAMTVNQRPFQVAMPGSGEISLHPEFEEIFKTFHDLGITPNYTTNGMWITDPSLTTRLIDATLKYVGGVAVSCHPHLEKYWKNAVKTYKCFTAIKVNLHIVISDKESIDYFIKIYNQFEDMVDYFVLLPYGNQGRAVEKNIDWEYLIHSMPEDNSKIAFGAKFYDYLLKGIRDIRPGYEMPVSLYPPESMSKFLDLKDMKLYKSSFDTKECINKK